MARGAVKAYYWFMPTYLFTPYRDHQPINDQLVRIDADGPAEAVRQFKAVWVERASEFDFANLVSDAGEIIFSGDHNA